MQSINLTALFHKKNRLALAFTSIALTQALVGCGHSGDKVANKEQPSQTSGKAETLDCGSPTIAGVLQQATLNQISQQATTNVQQLALKAGIANTNINLADSLSQMNIAVTNTSAIAGQADQCQANIAVTLPESIVSKANQIALSLNQPTVAQNLATKGLNLEKNTITAINAGFKLSPTDSSYKATPTNGSSTSSLLISEVGNLIANAQLAQLIGTVGTIPTLQSASSTDNMISNEPTKGSSAISNEPTTSQVIASNAPVIARQTQTVKQSDNPVVIKKTTTTTTHSDKPQTTVTKKVEKSTNVTTQNNDRKVVTTTTTQTTKNASAEKPVKEKAPTTVKKDTADTQMGPAAEMGPAAKPKPVAKSQADDEIKLIIEEKNEKY